jgi:hypothetical protein
LIFQALKNRENLAVRDGHLKELPVDCVKKASMYLQHCCIYLFMQYLASRGKEGLQDFKLDMFKKETSELTGVLSWVRVSIYPSKDKFFILCNSNMSSKPRTTAMMERKLKTLDRSHFFL